MAKGTLDTTKDNENSQNTGATDSDVANSRISMLREADKKNKEFEEKYGKNPSQAHILAKLKGSETFKDCETYEDAMKIVKDGKDPNKKDFSGQNPDLHYRMTNHVLSEEKIEEESAKRDFEKVFGKRPTKAGVFKELQKRSPAYQGAKNYEEAMEILKLKRPPSYKWITEHIDPDHPLQHASDAEIGKDLAERGLSPADLEKEKNEKIAAKKAELLKPGPTSEPVVTKTEKNTSSRWTEEDEAGRWWSKKTVKIEKKVEKESKEPKQKRKTHFWKSVGNTIARPFKTVNKLRRTAGRTLMAPTYFLADIGQKNKTGGKDLRQWYKDIWTGKKAA